MIRRPFSFSFFCFFFVFFFCCGDRRRDGKRGKTEREKGSRNGRLVQSYFTCYRAFTVVAVLLVSHGSWSGSCFQVRMTIVI